MNGKHGRVLALEDGSQVPYVTSGSYADVFMDQPGAKVYKLFISESEGGLRQTPKATLDAIRRENFTTQIEAYEIAGSDEFLASRPRPTIFRIGGGSIRARRDRPRRIARVSHPVLLAKGNVLASRSIATTRLVAALVCTNVRFRNNPTEAQQMNFHRFVA